MESKPLLSNTLLWCINNNWIFQILLTFIHNDISELQEFFPLQRLGKKIPHHGIGRAMDDFDGAAVDGVFYREIVNADSAGALAQR